jgi:hypothetical protein
VLLPLERLAPQLPPRSHCHCRCSRQSCHQNQGWRQQHQQQQLVPAWLLLPLPLPGELVHPERRLLLPLVLLPALRLLACPQLWGMSSHAGCPARLPGRAPVACLQYKAAADGMD